MDVKTLLFFLVDQILNGLQYYTKVMTPDRVLMNIFIPSGRTLILLMLVAFGCEQQILQRSEDKLPLTNPTLTSNIFHNNYISKIGGRCCQLQENL